eukprot:CAMPEP_0194570154 /NCGR_PEP_ID=MMETSP0292-20121207/7582_1 /TAXON_ID=39354 /ORGANISM="Heterosigma akashiwo, Strain CCMP2393" /LENGTH=160 /DNA_ID=CAMNT_0039420545 /DNA_START=254 /DNA_END=739 /DNA_ORIENTATION=+
MAEGGGSEEVPKPAAAVEEPGGGGGAPTAAEAFAAAAQPERAPDAFERAGLPWILNPNTKGGSLVVAALSLVFPVGAYYALQAGGMDELDAGRYVGVGFVVVSCVLWTATYLFRVATKDMTYAQQLKDYENAVLAKRLEELQDDEVQALIEEIEREDTLL